ncbi:MULTISPECIES: histidine phosphatase family protein [Arthrobacter]|uniref:Histidine phosphatase family protein n=1 Tax=Arthrobacter terricola TaxID=2547396 RepID=A0A4R5KGV6_9MICC|nr:MULTISPECIES: histidine phosphatase family protein [Arthrobacter]MBT8162132.1 histidine phosphatase family protein [Arthrobacter sp. GN70]TDF93945.1 histidine phosphatase family protein [Arthrobacter terricola]
MPQATVHLLRHGEVFNPDAVLYGRLPEFHLSDRGRQMAQMLADHFAARAAQGANIVYLASSPLTRAQETALPTSQALNLSIHTEPRIIEAENHFQGLHATISEFIKPKHWFEYRNPLRPSWGEPYKEQAARVRAAVDDARLKAIELGGDGAEAILVSHQLPIYATRLAAEGRPLWHDPRKRQCTLTSLTSLVFDDGGKVARVDYTEPAAVLLPGAASTPGA